VNTAVTAPAPNPAEINGDLKLTAQQLRAYLRYHEDRNQRNSERSRELGIMTKPIPLPKTRAPAAASPARVMVSAFFALAAERLRPLFAGRSVTMLDLGCGAGGAVLPFFEAVGLKGRYIGLDIARHRSWDANTSASFSRELIVADVHNFDAATLPPIDLLVSSTALEHIRDDRDSVQRIAARLAPGGAQVHYVPGEAALPFYGPHGWRQYSAACLREIFPEGDIYRAGGWCSSALHLRTVTTGGDDAWRFRHPAMYQALRRLSLVADRVLGNTPATMYGVIVPPTASRYQTGSLQEHTALASSAA